jgi:diguanylate cyclase (GGDEF)-like protein
LLGQRSVDIVMTDLKLTDESGLSLLDWVRRTAPRTARVLVTGAARLEDAADAINQTQVHRMILKPWRAEDLLQSLRAAARALLMERSHEQLLDELRRLNVELEQRVAERTRELEVANGQLQQKTAFLEKMALTDALTDLPNRRAIDLIAQKELHRRQRIAAPITFVLIDIDHFKQVNTDYTISGGDHALTWIASVLQASVRASDSLGRVGGEEFMVVAPNTDEAGAEVLAERLRAAVESAHTVLKRGRQLHLTISLGLAVANAETVIPMSATKDFRDSFKDFRDCAAVALTEAKESGRNRAVIRIYNGPSS